MPSPLHLPTSLTNLSLHNLCSQEALPEASEPLVLEASAPAAEEAAGLAEEASSEEESEGEEAEQEAPAGVGG